MVARLRGDGRDGLVSAECVELSVWCHSGTLPSLKSAAWTPRRSAISDSEWQTVAHSQFE